MSTASGLPVFPDRPRFLTGHGLRTSTVAGAQLYCPRTRHSEAISWPSAELSPPKIYWSGRPARDGVAPLWPPTTTEQLLRPVRSICSMELSTRPTCPTAGRIRSHDNAGLGHLPNPSRWSHRPTRRPRRHRLRLAAQRHHRRLKSPGRTSTPLPSSRSWNLRTSPSRTGWTSSTSMASPSSSPWRVGSSGSQRAPTTEERRPCSHGQKSTPQPRSSAPGETWRRRHRSRRSGADPRSSTPGCPRRRIHAACRSDPAGRTRPKPPRSRWRNAVASCMVEPCRAGASTKTPMARPGVVTECQRLGVRS